MNAGAILETLPTWFGVGAGGGVGFFAIKWIFEWAGGRVDKREAAAVANAERLDAATSKLIDNLERRLDAQDKRIANVESELIACRTQHAQCEAELTRLRAAVQGLGDAKQQAANIIAAEKAMTRTVAAIAHKTGESGQ